MSTTLYLPSNTTAAVSPTPSGTDWDGHINTISRQLLFKPNGSALATDAYTPDGADHIADLSAMIAQFVSQVLPPQAIPSQVVQLGLLALEANSGNNVSLGWTLYAVNIAGTSVLGTLVAYRKSAAGEMATSLTGEIDAATSTAFSDPGEPFRLVLEVGCDGSPTATTGTQGHNASIRTGAPTISASTAWPQDGDTTDAVPFLLFVDSDLLLGIANTAATNPYKVTGVTYDANGDVLGSCIVTLHKIVGSTLVYCDRVTSHASTGAYTLRAWDNDAAYIVTSRKTGSPNVLGIYPEILTPVAV